jgi:hypothetical protein
VIGKSGENLRRVQDAYGVEISVDKGTGSTRRVQIIGETQESVAKAREEVDYVKDFFDITADQFYVVFQANRRSLDEIRERCNVWRLRYVPERNQVELNGLRHEVEDAVMVLECHVQYYTVYVEMLREQDAIEGNLAEMDGARGGYGKGRSYGKGQDSWRSSEWDDNWQSTPRYGDGKGKSKSKDSAPNGKGKGKEGKYKGKGK